MGWGALLTAISALGFSSLSIFGKLAYGAGANVVTLLGFRFAMAALLLWAYVLLTRRPLPDRRTAFQLLFMGGVGYTAMSTLFLSSVAEDRLSPALAGLLLYTYPAIVTLLAWRFDGVHLGRRQMTALVATLGGTGLVLLAPGSTAVFTWPGALMALGASVVYSVYILLGSRVSRRSSPVVVTTFVSSAAAVVFLTFGAATGSLVTVAPAGWWAIAGTAFFATVIAVLFFFAGVDRLGPARASMISTLEPVGTAILSALVFADRLGAVQMVGGAIVLGGIVWLQSGADT